MNVNLEKKELINLLCGYEPNMNQCIELEKLGFMKYTGNQWNEDWGWEKSVFEKMEEEKIYLLYLTLTGKVHSIIKNYGDTIYLNSGKVCINCRKSTIRPCDKTCNDPCPHCGSTNTFREAIEDNTRMVKEIKCECGNKEYTLCQEERDIATVQFSGKANLFLFRCTKCEQPYGITQPILE